MRCKGTTFICKNASFCRKSFKTPTNIWPQTNCGHISKLLVINLLYRKWPQDLFLDRINEKICVYMQTPSYLRIIYSQYILRFGWFMLTLHAEYSDFKIWQRKGSISLSQYWRRAAWLSPFGRLCAIRPGESFWSSLIAIWHCDLIV